MIRAVRPSGETHPSADSAERCALIVMRSGWNSRTSTVTVPSNAPARPSFTMYRAIVQVPVGAASDVAYWISSNPWRDSLSRCRFTSRPRASAMTTSSGMPASGVAQSAGFTITPTWNASPGRYTPRSEKR